MPDFQALRCTAQGGWGGSAHYPDPTAQSVRVLRAQSRAPRPPARTVPGGPSHRAGGALAGRQTLPRPTRWPQPTATLRVALAGRQILPRKARGLRPLTLLARICHPPRARCALTGLPDGDLRSGHRGRLAAMGPSLPRACPGPDRRQGESPLWRRTLAASDCPARRTIALHRAALRRPRAMTSSCASSDGAPRSRHPATLRVRFGMTPAPRPEEYRPSGRHPEAPVP